MDRQHLRTWELHRLQHIDMPWWRTTTEGDLTLYTWSFANSKYGGGMWVPQSKFFSQFISCLGIVYVLASCSIKKMRGVAMVTTLSLHQQDTMVSTLSVLLLTLNKALLGGRPRITRIVLMPISLRIMLNHASCSLLSVIVCSGLNVWCTTHS